MKKAFTLIELLVVIGIIGILGSFVFVQTNNFLNSGKDSKRKSDVAMLASGVASYLSESVSLPVSTGCDINKTCSDEINQIFEVQLGTLPSEPNSNAYYKYQSDGTDCSVSAVLSTGKTYQYSCSTDEITTETPTTGVCGSLSNTTSTAYAESVTAWPSSDFCSSGTPSSIPTFPSVGSSTTWTCPGKYLGESTECTAYRASDGVCGSSNGTSSYSAPSSNLCNTGSASSVTTGSTSFTWNCSGTNNGSSISCMANKSINGSCGGSGPYSSLSSGTCSSGVMNNFSGSGPWYWTCSGINNGSSASCSASVCTVSSRTISWYSYDNGGNNGGACPGSHTGGTSSCNDGETMVGAVQTSYVESGRVGVCGGTSYYSASCVTSCSGCQITSNRTISWIVYDNGGNNGGACPGSSTSGTGSCNAGETMTGLGSSYTPSGRSGCGGTTTYYASCAIMTCN